jgi:hypothetical protein
MGYQDPAMAAGNLAGASEDVLIKNLAGQAV